MASANWSQWVAFVLCGFAAYMVVWGALKGAASHRVPRMTLGVVLTILTVAYLVAALDVIDDRLFANVLRGIGFVMFPAIAWTSWTGMRYARKIEHLTTILEGRETDEDAWKRHG